MAVVSLKFDYFFKYLMANEKVRKHFLSDVLPIPLDKIKSVRLANTFLWKKYRRQKQGVLDILLILNDDSKINIELQIKALKYWDKRSLFYLSKMFTEDLLIGENYAKLRKCIHISILDFNLNDRAEYHHIYHLRDQNGALFSELLEIHIIELGKKLEGTKPVDDWIRLFNARNEEDINMIKTKNEGILEAIRDVRQMSLSKGLKALYDAHLKKVRDQNARDDYVRDEGIAIGQAQGEARGIAIGQAQGEKQKLVSMVRKKMERDMSAAQIADLLEEDPVLVTKICTSIQKHSNWDDAQICLDCKLCDVD